MFGDDWTPAHLTGGKTNLYKEIAFALKGVEWRQPGLVAVASKLAGSAAPHKPIDVSVPDTYVPKSGPNPWAVRSMKAGMPAAEPMPAPGRRMTVERPASPGGVGPEDVGAGTAAPAAEEEEPEPALNA